MAGTENTKASELLHTPGGVRDIYGSACARKLEVQHSLEQVMHSYGFRNVQTPTFEYFDIFNKERGTAASNEMFKFFDRGNNTLVLRPDMTPAIGLVIVLDQLMIAMERQKLFGETALGGTLLVYPKEVRAQALQEAKKMREGGQVVQMMRKSSKKEIEEYVAYAKRNGNDSLIYLTKDGEKQQMIEAK